MYLALVLSLATSTAIELATTTMTPKYKGMNRAVIDAAYNNVKVEPDYQNLMKRFKERSQVIYDSFNVIRDIAYGIKLRQCFDWIFCGLDNAPTFIFIHGGYWQNYNKDDLAFVAKGPLERGFNVVLAEYTLAPHASMTEIVNEVGLLLDYLHSNQGEVGFGGRPVCICGHSAGGQLALMQSDHPSATLIMSVSAIYDLIPIAQSWINDKLRLSEREILDYSPMNHVESRVPAIVAVGMVELPELVYQSSEYASARNRRGGLVTFLPIKGRTHFSILDEIANPDGLLLAVVTENIAKTIQLRT
jgi:arylformamidase